MLSTAPTINPVNINIDSNRIGLDIFLLITGRNLLNAIPAISGNSNMQTMLIMSDKKSTSKDFTSSDKDGKSDDQKRKLIGVTMKAERDDQAVSVTERATLPRAMCE